MRLRINHLTEYEYSEPVFLEPQHLYFYPHFRLHIKLLSFKLSVNPEPSGLTMRLDAENNAYYQCWFNELISNSTINMSMEVESVSFDPFDFLVEERLKTSHSKNLEIYLASDSKLSVGMKKWATDLQASANHVMTDFLMKLCLEINNEFEHTIRYQSELLEPFF